MKGVQDLGDEKLCFVDLLFKLIPLSDFEACVYSPKAASIPTT